MQDNQQQLIIQTARTWLGTKFHHQGRVKKNKQNLGGCDCVGLIIGVGNELGIKPHDKSLNSYDTTQYGRIHKRNQLNTALASCFEKSTTISRGTILVFQINPDLQHCAIVSEIMPNHFACHDMSSSLAPWGEGGVRGFILNPPNPFRGRGLGGGGFTLYQDQTTQQQTQTPLQIKIIHCDAKARKVVENNLPEEWMDKMIGTYSFY